MPKGQLAQNGMIRSPSINPNMRQFKYAYADLHFEVELVAQLPPGAGDFVVRSGLSQQERHPEYEYEFGEPSACRSRPVDGDTAAVYTFGVIEDDLVYHWHDGPRILSVVSSSKGCRLRFGMRGPAEIERNVEKVCDVISVGIPSDTFFFVRFAARILHHFGSTQPGPALFGVSVHPDEYAGLTGRALETVESGRGSISMLTRCLPAAASQRYESTIHQGQTQKIELDWA